MAQLGFCEPRRRELGSAVGHILAAEDAQRQHLPGREFGTEVGVKALPRGRDQFVLVAALHEVVHGHAAHGTLSAVASTA